ncbi:hypothetical protein PROSTU_02007 [Providencia stuartii ATCC 25827]|uniref:Uncharacterized protein n=1 Tax=Providencia stuartii ATCC 25827 TaxID=471874 RepID=A0AA86YRC0_PROST|nr:hypothetical protein PROSTU_02007 [Providencia stuartii ATCC 25827]
MKLPNKIGFSVFISDSFSGKNSLSFPLPPPRRGVITRRYVTVRKTDVILLNWQITLVNFVYFLALIFLHSVML